MTQSLSSQPLPSSAGAGIISLRSAAFGYADRTVISGVTADIRKGEVVALLGPNGSGKTTLVKGLLGLSDQLGGEVDLFGIPRSQFHDFTRLGYVPQRHSLAQSVRATAEEIVSTGRLPHRRWWQPSGRGDAAIVAESLDLVGLADRATVDVSTLSGGQQRRVLIARALAAQPDVMIMDEPTAGVDSANQQALAHVLERLADRGTTMLIVTHELDSLRPVVTRILCTSNGRLDFDGTTEDYETRHVAATASVPGHDHAGHSAHPQDAHHHEEDLAPDLPSAIPGTGPFDAAGREGHRG